MSGKRHKDDSEKAAKQRITFSGSMIKLGAYASYSTIFILKKIFRTICMMLRAISSGIAGMMHAVLRKFTNAGRKIFSPVVSCFRPGRKKKADNQARTDMTVGSIRTTGFRQFVIRTAHICVPAAALIGFAFILSNASEIDRRIAERTTVDNDSFVSDFITEPVTEPEETSVPDETENTEITELTEETALTACDDSDYTESTGIFIDGELIGCVADETELKKIFDSELESIRKQDGVTDAEYKNKIEFVKGKYPGDKLTDTDGIMKLLGTGNEEVRYTAEEGDTLSWIADDFGLSLDELLEMNSTIAENPDLFSEGTELVVALNRQTLPVIVTKEIQEYTVIPYNTKTVESESLDKGDTEITEWGENGEALSTLLVKYEGNAEISREVVKTETVKEPVDETVAVGIFQSPAEAYPDSEDTVLNGNGMFMWPVNGGAEGNIFVSGTHNGLDIEADEKSDVYAAADGKIIAAGWNRDGYGYFVMIDHGNGYATLYSGMSRVIASRGDQVKRGELIGRTGSSGNESGEHLHFEVRKNNICENPAEYISVNASEPQENPDDE